MKTFFIVLLLSFSVFPLSGMKKIFSPPDDNGIMEEVILGCAPKYNDRRRDIDKEKYDKEEYDNIEIFVKETEKALRELTKSD